MDSFKSSVAEAFGLALRLARTDAGLSQEKLALDSGVDRTFVSMLERGVRQPSLSTIFALCEILPRTPGELVAEAAILMTPKKRKRR